MFVWTFTCTCLRHVVKLNILNKHTAHARACRSGRRRAGEVIKRRRQGNNFFSSQPAAARWPGASAHNRNSLRSHDDVDMKVRRTRERSGWQRLGVEGWVAGGGLWVVGCVLLLHKLAIIYRLQSSALCTLYACIARSSRAHCIVVCSTRIHMHTTYICTMCTSMCCNGTVVCVLCVYKYLHFTITYNTLSYPNA